MKAWIFQDPKQLAKLGDKDCPWSTGWYDPDGKRKSKTMGSKSAADSHRRKVEGQLAAGVYNDPGRQQWEKFETEIESKLLAGMEYRTRETTQLAIDHFKRIVKPVRMATITTKTIADYVAARRLERKIRPKGESKRKNKSKATKEIPFISPTTINKELRTLRAILRKAARWGFLAKAPEFEFLREPGKLPTYINPEDFATLYAKCGAATRPDVQGCEPGDFWRGLLVAAYMTGWRISSLLALRWEDVDLDRCTALSRAADNKGKRDQKTPLHPLVIEHITKLRGFSPHVFNWPHRHRKIFEEFNALQDAAGRQAGRREASLWLSRPAAGVCHDERGHAHPGRVAAPNATPRLSNHAALHQHGSPVESGCANAVCPDAADVDCGGRGLKSRLEGYWKVATFSRGQSDERNSTQPVIWLSVPEVGLEPTPYC
jgi:integrase